MVMARKRITISLNSEMPADKAVWEFISGLPRRTRSEIIKEILLDVLEKRDERTDTTLSKPDITSGERAMDPDEIIEKLF
jgi:metal-responsive CopG/Arc/MetJ family transcriptional regulator